ncbi:KpsF/GutQ family sugar-phosphate isomerase [Murimonas intestini]|uniref:Arabinose-5-phosphate isomerase n=1 Tax=Murimonas intestini TaxID=1337051 RepID=A0AB73T951_9FIRM|nr:KpsF/GutQ family sugar-phosphate isomerase [Murimonas intestini]MCR1839497.1 KpsF/GutQ family sugar-phosphate isomerase [Murimonas intestini]MCR1867961.1 KpsF/GutQ family sugar-phosphate isomerase [Murimonas intestini]MCR1882401.1 KpsF/GutQ family sugar-phosphate isomerase [Murimonas intestini]
MKKYEMAKEVFEKEIEALKNISYNLDEVFDKMLEAIIACQGKVVFIGMGKSGHIAGKMAATMSSLGTCAISIHPGECMHGDLGMIQKSDVVVLISYSGESDEILRIIPSINIIGANILGITCNRNSSLAKACKIVQVFENVKEACHMGLAPTTSTTVVLVYGDALAVTAARLKGFDKKEFGVFHPAGSLGKRLTVRSIDLMHGIHDEHNINENTTLTDALIAISESDTDLLTVVNEQGKLIGIVTNGDLKRKIKENVDIYVDTVKDLIHFYPYFVDVSSMAVEALKIMEDNGIHSLPIVKEEHPIGVVEKRDILKIGIYL